MLRLTDGGRSFEWDSGAGSRLRELHALTLSEALDLAFSVFRSNFRVLAGLTVLTYAAPVALLYAVIYAYGDLDPASLDLVLLPVLMVLFSLLTGAITIAVADDFLASGPRAADSLGRALRFVWPLTLAAICVGIPILAGLVLGLASITGGATLVLTGQDAVAALAGGVIGAVGLAILCVFVFAAAGLFLFSPIIVLEDLGALAALRRCWRLMRGYRRRVVGLVVLWLILSMGPSVALDWLLPDVSVVHSIARAGIEAFIAAYIAVAEVVLYFDIRVRAEAFDLDHLARAVEANAPAA